MNELGKLRATDDDHTMTSEEMHQVLFNAITEHSLLPGTTLREEELAEAFGVSRTRIRELLFRLNHLGMLLLGEFAGVGPRFLSVDPGEMNTRMHADAMPDVDPESLRDPADVAAAIVALIRASDRIASGARLIANTEPVVLAAESPPELAAVRDDRPGLESSWSSRDDSITLDGADAAQDPPLGADCRIA